ncbi:unnamed protein product, partial [Allacma fusca]
MKLLEANY